jgi:hypothetical protein
MFIEYLPQRTSCIQTVFCSKEKRIERTQEIWIFKGKGV